ncbi:hypothetical protein CEXT_815121 [Caerostris extrusa]|uniref:Uncharacterized protein n=1 Tax=Caerostris extrusa TaxID=172846 RepID=A0AAV4U123_CAEEX|nr:hypothetical protein CEXT_815121 [Caerostris extrusa]
MDYSASLNDGHQRESDASKAFLEFFGLRPPLPQHVIKSWQKNGSGIIVFFPLPSPSLLECHRFRISSHTLQTHRIVPDQSFAFVAVVTLGGRVIVLGHEQRGSEERALTTNGEEHRTLMGKVKPSERTFRSVSYERKLYIPLASMRLCYNLCRVYLLSNLGIESALFYKLAGIH